LATWLISIPNAENRRKIYQQTVEIGAFVSIADTGAFLASSFLQLGGASLLYTFDEKLNDRDRSNFGTATVSAPKQLKMSFVPGFGFGHESFGQATATAETGDWFRPTAECV